MVSCWRGEITVTSNAVGFPRFQQGKKISAGRELDDDTRDGTSFLGAKAADWAAEKMVSLRELCRWMRSPLPLQPTWWSPKPSVTTWQTGQVDPSWHIWTPSQYHKHNRKSWSWICRPRTLEGTTFSQSPAWWTRRQSQSLWPSAWSCFSQDIKGCLVNISSLYV